jgi:ubiquinone/menaquinone biosynthesis C-methylase UbiE
MAERTQADSTGGRMRDEVSREPAYTMGRSQNEERRLSAQAALYERPTRFLFEGAGITQGMRVLDVGSGAGDVSFLVAALVGDQGHVVGIDMNPDIVTTATVRAGELGLEQVAFVAGDVREARFDEEFDAVVGRLILMYSADPVTTLAAAVRNVRDGGVVAFYEGDAGSAAFSHSGVELFMGTKLHEVFVAAGLPAPQMNSHALIGGDRDWLERFVSAYGSPVIKSLMPQILASGVATENEIDVDTFDQRYLEQVLGLGGVVQFYQLMGAWAHKPPA